MRQINKAGTQLMARCFFNRCTGEVTYESLSRYYGNESNEPIKH